MMASVILDFECPRCGCEKRITADVSAYVDRSEKLESSNAELLAALELAARYVPWHHRTKMIALIAKAKGEA